MTNINFVEGINIIAKYIPKNELESYGINVGHDQLCFGADEWVTDEIDRLKLDELGWFIHEDSWSCWT